MPTRRLNSFDFNLTLPPFQADAQNQYARLSFTTQSTAFAFLALYQNYVFENHSKLEIWNADLTVMFNATPYAAERMAWIRSRIADNPFTPGRMLGAIGQSLPIIDREHIFPAGVTPELLPPTQLALPKVSARLSQMTVNDEDGDAQLS